MLEKNVIKNFINKISQMSSKINYYFNYISYFLLDNIYVYVFFQNCFICLYIFLNTK